VGRIWKKRKKNIKFDVVKVKKDIQNVSTILFWQKLEEKAAIPLIPVEFISLLSLRILLVVLYKANFF